MSINFKIGFLKISSFGKLSNKQIWKTNKKMFL